MTDDQHIDIIEDIDDEYMEYVYQYDIEDYLDGLPI